MELELVNDPLRSPHKVGSTNHTERAADTAGWGLPEYYSVYIIHSA